MSMDLAQLRAEIEQRFGTVYRFIKVSGLPRSMVYAVLGQKYGGDAERQVARIRAALISAQDPARRVYTALETVACARCRRPGPRPCLECQETMRAQARAVMSLNSQLG
ncbi:hypothetical protein V6C53_09340 [Desulfocurvibacter africanus]|uniref:hypothetical protein n=1 Tax=Desulfocurvibacter africanus TaxID=873 RepID=UPI002FD8C8FA